MQIGNSSPYDLSAPPRVGHTPRALCTDGPGVNCARVSAKDLARCGLATRGRQPEVGALWRDCFCECELQRITGISKRAEVCVHSSIFLASIFWEGQCQSSGRV